MCVMRVGGNLFARLSRRLDIPSEALPYGFGLSLCGRGELSVRGCRRIVHYAPERICLDLGKEVLRVEGRGLLCASFGAGEVRVVGEIDVIGFEKEEA